MNEIKTNRPILLLAVVALTVAISGCKNGGNERPNIVLITIDTLRADRLGAYGYERGLTPHLDELANHGVIFERALTTAGTTWPAHASMLTGLYPRYHGLRRNGLELAADVPLVAELLSKSGYATASFVSYKGMHFRGRLDRGFQVASDRQNRKSASAPIRSGAETTAMALDWLKDQAGSSDPAFLWLHLFEPHSPYELTDYARQWMEKTGYEGFLADGASIDELRERRLDILASADHVAAMNALYDGEIQLADALVGQLLDKLKIEDRLDNSVVIVVSDHGQDLGENGNMGHGPTLREDVLHVPLIIRDFRSNRGGRVAEAVSVVDLAPTIAQTALDIELPGVQGRTLTAHLGGASDQGTEREVFAEVRLWPDMEEAPAWYDEKAMAIYADGLKFKTEHGQTSIFDPRVAPSSEKRLDAPDVNESLLAYLDSLRAEFLAGEIQPVEVQLTLEEIEALRSLGYIQ